MNENNENDATQKSEINATMAFIQSLWAILNETDLHQNIAKKLRTEVTMKKTFIPITIIGVLLISICSKCEMDPSYTIDLVNESGHSIGYYFATGGKYGTYYPDSLPETNNYIMYDINKVIQPGYESHLGWEKFFKNLPNHILSVFIFHTDTLNKYSWEEVRDGYKILKRYDLSYDDLKQMDWTIIYP